MAEIARALGRRAAPRDTLYRPVALERVAAALAAAPLTEVVQTLPGDAKALSRAAFATS
jgi:hypothetical protein